jgi:hypothetical protein
VDSTSVYWASTGSIMKVPLACGTPASLAPAVGAGGIAVAATGVYWTQIDSNGFSVRTVPLGGGEVTTIASYPNGINGAIAVDATNVYWSHYDPSCVGTRCVVIASAPLAGGPSASLVTGLGPVLPNALAVDDTSVYWMAQVQGPPCGNSSCSVVYKLTPK